MLYNRSCSCRSLALFDDTDTVLVSTPIGHTTGLLIGFMAVLRGAVWIITQPYLGVKETARVVNEYKVCYELYAMLSLQEHKG